MKYIWKDVYLAGVMGLLVPGLLLNVGVKFNEEAELNQIVTEAVVIATEPMAEPAGSLTVRLKDRQGIRDLDLETYLVGVVLAEMPASFKEEALKAQAVVARTYTVRAKEGKGKHDDGDICGDSACCQGYLDPTDYSGTEEALSKVRNAVLSTAGQVLIYEGKLIEATYFSCSGGTTEDAVAVWGTDVPYLQSVQSPGEENAAYYTDSVEFSVKEFAERLGINLTGQPDSWLGDVKRTAGGGVDTMDIGGLIFKGTELRKLLGLRSTAISITATDEKITVTTRGYGHRVGMSQYGADAMALLGSTYEEILAHYYQGTELKNWFD